MCWNVRLNWTKHSSWISGASRDLKQDVDGLTSPHFHNSQVYGVTVWFSRGVGGGGTRVLREVCDLLNA